MNDATAAPAPSPLRRYLGLAVVGVLGGLLSGAFGVGGGIIMVPLLIWLAGLDQRRAAATSLIAIVPTAIAGTVGFGVQGQVDWIAALLVGAGGMAGSLVGTRLLRDLPIGWLRWLFIGLLLVVAVRSILEVPARGAEIALTPWSIAGLVVLGVAMGVASGLFGIGGGVIAVPVLIGLFGASDLLAKGSSLLAMIPTSITGSVQNLRNGMVELADGLVCGIAATAASFGGVALAFWLDPRWSVILFGILVLFAATQLTVRAIRQGRAGQ